MLESCLVDLEDIRPDAQSCSVTQSSMPCEPAPMTRHESWDRTSALLTAAQNNTRLEANKILGRGRGGDTPSERPRQGEPFDGDSGRTDAQRVAV